MDVKKVWGYDSDAGITCLVSNSFRECRKRRFKKKGWNWRIEDWKEMYEACFGNVKASHHLIDMNVEMETRREDGLKTFTANLKSIWLYMTNPDAKKIMDEGRKIAQFQGEFGYGLFVSRK